MGCQGSQDMAPLPPPPHPQFPSRSLVCALNARHPIEQGEQNSEDSHTVLEFFNNLWGLGTELD